jgi:hypothetical protein
MNEPHDRGRLQMPFDISPWPSGRERERLGFHHDFLSIVVDFLTISLVTTTAIRIFTLQISRNVFKSLSEDFEENKNP